MLYEIFPTLWFEFAAVFRRRRTIVGLILYILSAASLVFGLAYLQSEFERALKNVGVPTSELGTVFAELLSRTQALSPDKIDYILRIVIEWPVSVWLFQACSLLLMPSLIAMVSSDMIAIDVYRRTLRFTLLKARRSAYFIGKILAHFFLFSIVQAVSLGTLVFMSLQYPSTYSAALIIRAGVVSYLYFLPFILIAVILTAWISSWCNKPQSALILAHAVWIVALFISPYVPSFTPFNPLLVLAMLFPLEVDIVLVSWNFLVWICGLLALGLAGFLYREV